MDETKIFPNHHSIRLPGYDYSQEGSYFITIVCQDRRCLFGDVKDKSMYLDEAGRMINDWCQKMPELFPGVSLGSYVIMPNHVHFILNIDDRVYRDNVRPGTRPGPTAVTLGDIVGAFKSLTTTEYIKGVKTKNWQRFNKRLWQEDYWEHIIRAEEPLYKIEYYIKTNPEEWAHDEENPINLKHVVE